MEKLAITVMNRKGGTGKTTIASILTQLAISDNKRVIAYDLDEQRNLTDTLVALGIDNIRHQLGKHDEDEDTDVFILDCPPSLSSTTMEAIDFADIVLIPIRPDSYSLANLDILYDEIGKIGKVQQQAALVKNGFNQTLASTQIEGLIQSRGFPVAGRLPQNQRIINNIAQGTSWSRGMPWDQQASFCQLYKRIIIAFERMLGNDVEGMWK